MKKIFTIGILCFLISSLYSQNTAITVIAPNGGENWQIGCPYVIQWISAMTVPVKIELYKNGNFYRTIANQVPANQNTFSWTPGYNITPASDFKVKITALTSSGAFDFSNGNFTISIGYLTVTSPNGGEIWQYGTTHMITWNDNICENVRIELWKNGAYFSLITALTPSTGSFPWAITSSIPAGNDYKIKIMSALMNASNVPTLFDFSDNNFTIGSANNCMITVTSPNGGEVWIKGSTHAITWTDNIPYNVRIELWKDGLYNSLITASTPSTGTYYWAIPTTLPSGSTYKVKVLTMTSNASGNCYDFSDNNFSILGVTATPLKSSEMKARIYPNPCDDQLSINMENDFLSPVFIEIRNITGQTVSEERFDASLSGDDLKINTSSLANGYYILVARQNNEILFRNSLIIKH